MTIHTEPDSGGDFVMGFWNAMPLVVSLWLIIMSLAGGFAIIVWG